MIKMIISDKMVITKIRIKCQWSWSKIRITK